MYERLQRLLKLCKATEPDIKPTDEHLFSSFSSEAYQMTANVAVNYDELTEEEIADIMRRANIIWKYRRKVRNGDVDGSFQSQLEYQIENKLQKGNKIEAIKIYRTEMEKLNGKGIIPTLQESKDWVDNFESGLKARNLTGWGRRPLK